MRLKQITLRGFGSYRDEVTVDLDGLTFTGVVGRNYSGKSTLIFDALAWALFSWSRPDLTGSDVISRGEPSAQVTVDFSMGGQDYRVMRTLTRSGRHEAVLYVHDDAADDGWNALTDKHPGEANKAIADLLGMGSTAALATWMVRQNDFDALLAAKPAARRDILVEVFNLGRYGVYAKDADTRRKAASTQRRDAEATVAALDDVLAGLDAQDAANPLAEFGDDDLADKDQEITAAIKDLDAALSSADSLDALIAAAADAHKAVEEQAASEERIRTSYRGALEQARRTAAAAKAQAERAVAQAQETVKRAAAERDAANQRVEDIAMAAFDLEPRRKRAAESAQTVTTRESEVEALSASISSAKAAQAGLEAQIERTKADLAKERARLSQIEVTVREGDGECFTCHQDLSPEAAQALLEDQKKVLEGIASSGREMSTQHQENAQRIADSERTRADAQRILTEARAKAAEDARKVALIEQQIAGQAQAEADVLAATERADAAREAVKAAQEDLAKATADGAEQVATAQAQVDGVSTDSERLEALRAAAAKADTTLTNARAAQGGADAERLTAERNGLKRQQQSLWGEVTRRQEVAKQRESTTAKRDKAAADLEAAAREEREWEFLRRAFSPSGIPARILADIVSEVSDATNDVLVELGAEFEVDISTLRAAKTKGAADKEEVNFTVITADGEAKYASLSGAEKFMVALAVRVALAQCLARRTGAPIETMVLDEGWGNLDPDHRTAMMSVLANLAQRFSIYAITHVDDVRDGFSSLIEVSKETGTSTVEVQQVS